MTVGTPFKWSNRRLPSSDINASAYLLGTLTTIILEKFVKKGIVFETQYLLHCHTGKSGSKRDNCWVFYLAKKISILIQLFYIRLISRFHRCLHALRLTTRSLNLRTERSYLGYLSITSIILRQPYLQYQHLRQEMPGRKLSQN